MIWRVVEQLAQAEAVDAGVVGNGGQAGDAGIAQGADQRFGNAAQAEAADGDGLAILDDAGQRRCRVGINFVHDCPSIYVVEALRPSSVHDCRVASQHKIRQPKAQYRRNTGTCRPSHCDSDTYQMNAASAIDYETHFPARAGRHVHLGKPRDPVAATMRWRPCSAIPAPSSTASPSRYSTPRIDEFLRTGDRIIPIMNAKGRYSDERIMRRANGELFWCHVTGHAMHAERAAGRGHLDVRGCQREASGDGRADPARARNRRAAGGRQDQQGHRPPDRPQPAHGGNAPRQADAQVRRRPPRPSWCTSWWDCSCSARLQQGPFAASAAAIVPTHCVRELAGRRMRAVMPSHRPR